MYVNSELVQYREKDALTWCESSVPVVSVLFLLPVGGRKPASRPYHPSDNAPATRAAQSQYAP